MLQCDVLSLEKALQGNLVRSMNAGVSGACHLCPVYPNHAAQTKVASLRNNNLPDFSTTQPPLRRGHSHSHFHFHFRKSPNSITPIQLHFSRPASCSLSTFTLQTSTSSSRDYGLLYSLRRDPPNPRNDLLCGSITLVWTLQIHFQL